MMTGDDEKDNIEEDIEDVDKKGDKWCDEDSIVGIGLDEIGGDEEVSDEK